MFQSNLKFIKVLTLALLVCLGGGWLSGLVTREGIEAWYKFLIKPPGTPPNFIFPIVWSVLYASMAFSVTLLWFSQKSPKYIPLILFLIQLILNFCWSYIFFGLKNPALALLDISLLWLFLIATIIFFRQYTRMGAYLLIPYFAWVTYAMYLNGFILYLNYYP